MNNTLSDKIWISLGANIAGRWGTPQQNLTRGISELEALGFTILSRSSLYLTVPLGRVRQPHFLNMVVAMRGSVGPAALLRLLKRIEHSAGRRKGARWGPRPLDLDILDHGGRIFGTPPRGVRPQRLILPHPESHRRGFVLVPLAEIAPWWRHPRLGITAKSLLMRQPSLRRGVHEVAL
ncbi:MAG: 2-amino-4-hydroxy-6-hydroxymethyldihydropteridine diphosphokinase [Bacteroidota bacterium]